MSALLIAMSGVWTRNRTPSTPARVARLAKRLECADELRPAVGIAGVVQRIDTDHEVARIDDLGPAQRKRQQDRVARGHIRVWNPIANLALRIPVARDAFVGRQRRPTDRPEIDGQLQMTRDAKRAGNSARGFDLASVPLTVRDRQCEELEAVGLRDRGGGV